jgi:hypothetical protein
MMGDEEEGRERERERETQTGSEEHQESLVSADEDLENVIVELAEIWF